MITHTELKSLKPRDKIYKVADQLGMYVAVTTGGSISFRYDYALAGKRATLVLGKFDADIPAKGEGRALDELGYGMAISLAEARTLHKHARRQVEQGESPNRAKAENRLEAAEEQTFGWWATKYLDDANVADSTRAMRKFVYAKNLSEQFGNIKLDALTERMVRDRCDDILKRGAEAPAVQTREIVYLVYRYVNSKGIKIENPAESIRPSDIATFKPRDRALEPGEIRTLFTTLERTATMPTLRLAVKFMLITMVRKSEFINATWDEINFDTGVWTIPKERMKGGKAHNVYLSQQALEILVAFKTCFPNSEYLHPNRYDVDKPISLATLNRVLDVTFELIKKEFPNFEDFTVHDLRRTASSQLNERGFNSDWIEKCLAHHRGGVRAVYNKAEYAHQRRVMLQCWADMVDAWTKGEKTGDIVRAALLKCLHDDGAELHD